MPLFSFHYAPSSMKWEIKQEQETTKILQLFATRFDWGYEVDGTQKNDR